MLLVDAEVAIRLASATVLAGWLAMRGIWMAAYSRGWTSGWLAKKCHLGD